MAKISLRLDEMNDSEFAQALREVGVSEVAIRAALAARERKQHAVNEKVEQEKFVEEMVGLDLFSAPEDDPIQAGDLPFKDFIPGRPMACAQCGDLFYPKRRWAKYCRRSCSNQAYWERKLGAKTGD